MENRFYIKELDSYQKASDLSKERMGRLLGHKSLKNVKYYRKMSNQILANDTRKARNRLSQMVLECLDGWEEEYEQIRHDDSL